MSFFYYVFLLVILLDLDYGTGGTMTKTLTEQWKNGELGFGYYYIDFGIGGVPMLFNGLEFYCERTQKPNAIKTILAPVPSYDHFSQLGKKVKRLKKQLKIAKKALKEYAD